MVSNMRKNYPGLTIETLKSGNVRVRVRVEGQPNRKIVVKVPIDHPKFSEHYWNARAGVQLPEEPVSTAIRRSLRWLADNYLDHLEHMVQAGLNSPLTLRQRRSLLDRLCDHKHTTGTVYGDMSLHAPKSAFIQARDARAATPAEADNMMKAAKAMYRWAIQLGHTNENPVAGVERIHISGGGATPWTAQDLKKFRQAHPPGSMAHLSLTLHMFCACRSNDAIWIGRAQEVDRAGIRMLEWQPRKKGSAPVCVPMMPPLRKAITAAARIGGAYLLTDHGKPFTSPDSYRNKFRKWCDAAGLENRSSHGVRKAIAELLAESGCSENQIMSVLSHTKPTTSAVYTKGAERRILAVEAMRAIEGIDW